MRARPVPRPRARVTAATVRDEVAEVATDVPAGPSFVVAIAPIIVVIATNYVVAYHVLPIVDTSYLAEEKWGATSITSVRGIWAIIVALVVAILLVIALNWSSFRNLRRSLNEGTLGSMLPIFNTASEVGYGATIASLPAFTIIRDAVLNVAPGNPVISLAVAVNVLAGITGSASGGLSIALKTLGTTYVELGEAVRHQPGSDAPCRHPLLGRLRRPAAQWRGHHAAGHLRPEPPRTPMPTSAWSRWSFRWRPLSS